MKRTKNKAPLAAVLVPIFSILATVAIILGAILDREPVRTVPVEGKDAYLLEFNDGYIRVYRDKGPVLDDEGNAYKLASPWDADDLPEVRIIKDGEGMRLVHPDYKPYRLTHNSASPADWTLQPVEVIP